MRALLVFLVACAPSQAEMDRTNASSLAQANAGATQSITPFTPTYLPVSDPTDPDTARMREYGSPVPAAPAIKVVKIAGLRDTEHLGVTDDGTVVLLGPMCVVPARCGEGCVALAEYKFGHAEDGHVVIARVREDRRAVKTVNDDSCPAGCGGGAQQGPPMPQLPQGRVLGAIDPHSIEIRDEPHVVEYVDRVCTNTTPVP